MECTAKRLCSDDSCDKCWKKSFASCDKAEFWSDYNITVLGVRPRDVSKGSKKKFWFDCDACKHSFETQLASITRMHSWCPYCAVPSKVVCGDENCDPCRLRSFASCDKACFWSDRNELKPKDVLLNSNKKYWFVCDKCVHEFEAKLDDVNKGQWCPFCAGKKLCTSTSCTICTKRSFVSSDKAEFWASWNEVTPSEVLLNSHQKYWFICYKCDHYFDSSLDSIEKGNWCPFCTHKALCSVKECTWCHDNSFSSSDKAVFWSPENTISARNVAKSSNTKHSFICPKCEHSFDSKLDNITLGDNWCPFCAGKSLCEDQDCEHCFNRSFAFSDKAAYWSDYNECTPRSISLNSHEKFWFGCPEESCQHEFEMTPNHITSSNQWCPMCKKKTARKLLEHLETKYEVVLTERHFPWCKLQRELPYDFYIPSINLLIELDGPQHFKQISNWEDPEDTQKRDEFKNASALENDYPLIRLLQEDVLYDRNEWEDVLNQAIEYVITANESKLLTIYEGVWCEFFYV
jgi:very-short-patch-repair endonuclease